MVTNTTVETSARLNFLDAASRLQLEAALTFSDYQHFARRVDKIADSSLDSHMFYLANEMNRTVTEVQSLIEDSTANGMLDDYQIAEALGRMLQNTAALASVIGVSLEKIARMSLEDVRKE